MLKAIFFDIDNTLLSFDKYVIETMKSGFRRFGIAEYTDDMYQTFTKINVKLWQDIEKGELTFEELKRTRWNIVFKALGLDFDGPTFEEYFRACLCDSAIEEDGASEILNYLFGKYTLCAVSNGPYIQQKNRLEKGDMLRYFDQIFISEQIGSSKPSVEFFKTCFERLNENKENAILPDEVLIVGDSLTSDMAGGIAYGMKTCFYNPANIAIDETVKLDFVISSLSELKNIL